MKDAPSNIPDHSIEHLVKPLLRYLNETPELQSLLYDMDMMPEQLTPGSHEWMRMLMLGEAWKNRGADAP